MHPLVAPALPGLLLALLLGACGPPAAPAAGARNAAELRGQVPPGTPPEVDIVRARARGLTQAFEWHPYAKETFERAAREKKFILLDGAAAWCHWCHVMDETTYKDAEVGKLLAERFIAIRVDIDEHPDIAERYGDWGWPATILMTSDGSELGKLRGYIPPAELLPVLETTSRGTAVHGDKPPSKVAKRAATTAELPWAIASTLHTMDAFYDSDLGGWGRRQKSPVGENLELDARRAARGNQDARLRVLQTVAAQRDVLDPVWGGVYQYSTGGTWKSPHFEKLMTYQAANLAGYAMVYRATKDPGARKDAESVAGYMSTFLSSDEGAFYATQDADVGSHDPSMPFIDGHVYFDKSDAQRRALGMPRVDKNVYAFENGIAIAAFVSLHEATGSAQALERAKKAADLILATHVDAEGRVVHDAARPRSVMFLADAAGFGFALAELARVTGEARYKDAAIRIAAGIERGFNAPDGVFFGSTVDTGAVGVFAQRRRPFDHNALAARLFAACAKLSGDDRLRSIGIGVLAGLSTPGGIEGQGRFMGGFLLAADDLGLLDPAL